MFLNDKQKRIMEQKAKKDYEIRMAQQDAFIEELASREVSRRDLLHFTKYTMPEYQINWHHRLICETVQRMLLPIDHPDALRKVIISLAPRHGKSELISRRLPAFLLGINLKTQIIACSYNATFATKIARDVKKIMMQKEYSVLFPDTILPDNRKDNQSLSNTKDLFELKEGGYYRSAGVGGAITGLGAHWLILDDPYKNREDADSDIIRSNVSEWYRSTFRTRGEKDPRILIVQTRWHPDDISGELIEMQHTDENADQFHVIKLPAICDEMSDYDERAIGEALWPDKYGLNELNNIKLSIGEREFNALYQQNPTVSGSNEWGPELFPDTIWCEAFPEIAKRTGTVIAIDPSVGTGSRMGDYSAIVAMCRDDMGNLYIDTLMDRMNIEKLKDAVCFMANKYRPEIVACEANAFQHLLINEFKERLSKLALTGQVIGLKNNINKEIRIRRLGPYLEKGQFKFVRSAGNLILLKQLKSFPVGSHDDGPDSMEQALRSLINLFNFKVNNGIQIYGINPVR
jgi:predicted phage terminase large subunit-like protein